MFDTIKHLEDLDCTGAILAPDDGGPLTNTGFRFGNIIDTDANTKASRLLMEEYPESIFEERYFLNCIWMYDTSLLNGNALLEELISTMNKYPICPCNEMTIMNLIFTFKYKVWKRFPHLIGDKKLFGWVENNDTQGNTWRDFYFVKYPCTINFDCD